MRIASGWHWTRAALRRAAREPFLHFLLLGAAMFAIHAAFAPRDERRIEVTRADIEHLRAASLRQWGRDPAPAQLEALVKAHVREEVLYREALATGLDRDDVVIRRRLAQKMEFVAQSGVVEPGDDEAREYLRTHADRYSAPASVAFSHVYFGHEGGVSSAVNTRMIALLQAGGRVEGKRFMLPSRLSDQSFEDVAREFGAQFAKSVFAAPVGRWSGPYESAHGLHYVRVEALAPAHPAAFEQVRERVLADLASERIAAARDAAFAPLRSRYQVYIEPGAARIAATP